VDVVHASDQKLLATELQDTKLLARFIARQ